MNSNDRIVVYILSIGTIALVAGHLRPVLSEKIEPHNHRERPVFQISRHGVSGILQTATIVGLVVR